MRHAAVDGGKNLQDHLQICNVFKVTCAATLNQRHHNLFSRAARGIEYAVKRSGTLSMAPS